MGTHRSSCLGVSPPRFEESSRLPPPWWSCVGERETRKNEGDESVGMAHTEDETERDTTKDITGSGDMASLSILATFANFINSHSPAHIICAAPHATEVKGAREA